VVALFCAALSMAAGGLVLLLARQLGASPAVAGALPFLSSTLLIDWLSARPQLVDYVAVLVLVMLLRSLVHGEHHMRALLRVGILSAVWVNLHSAALLRVGVAGAAGAMLLLSRTRRVGAAWCLAAMAACAV
jgi:hypothetical protein